MKCFDCGIGEVYWYKFDILLFEVCVIVVVGVFGLFLIMDFVCYINFDKS